MKTELHQRNLKMRKMRRLPLWQALSEHRRGDWWSDLFAGLTVGVMLVPQGMAYALLAGLPPIYGLYAATVPLLTYALLGPSRQLAVGPAALVSLLTATGLAPLAVAGSEAYLALAFALAVLVGLIQLGWGLLRGGNLITYLARPVVLGFTTAAALIIGLSQVQHLLGLTLAGGRSFPQVLLATLYQLPEANGYSVAIGLVATLLIVATQRWSPRIPGALLVVVLGIGVVYFFDLDRGGVAILGEVPRGLPHLHWPTALREHWWDLLPTALAIAGVGFMESMAIVQTLPRRPGSPPPRPNRELLALGLGNLLGGFFQAYPTTGGLSRSLVNARAGARSGLASLLSAGLIVLTLLFLTPLFYYLPKAVLAAIILVAVVGILRPGVVRQLWRSDRTDGLLLGSTFVATLLGGIVWGLGLGILLSLLLLRWRMARVKTVGGDHQRARRCFPPTLDLGNNPEWLQFRCASLLHFANVAAFREQLDRAVAERGAQVVFLDFSELWDLDGTALHTLLTLLEDYRVRGVTLYLTGAKGPVRDALRRSGLAGMMGERATCPNLRVALTHYEGFIAEKSPKETRFCDGHHQMERGGPLILKRKVKAPKSNRIMKVEQLYTKCLAEATYYIESAGSAVLIDPLRETQVYLDKLAREGAQLQYIFETHFHADFVSGHLDLARKTGAQIVYGPLAQADYDFYSATDGEILPLGDVSFKVLHTPGHTMESTTFLLRDATGRDHAIFTGDTLFLGDVGRPDLAVQADRVTEEDLARLLYHSLHDKIIPLADELLVYPGHGAGSACGKNLSSETWGRLGTQKAQNYALRADMTEAEFVREVLSGRSPAPQYFAQNARLNKSGYESFDQVLERAKRPLEPLAFARVAREADTLVLDVRSPAEFAAGHLPGAIFIGLDGSFAPWVGALLPDLQQSILLVAPEGRAEEAITRLARVGYDRVRGYLAGGMAAWEAVDQPVARVSSISAARLAEELEQGAVAQVLDVRRHTEFLSQHLLVAQNFPLDYIQGNWSKLDPERRYHLHCAGGYRSMIAASILQARGIAKVVNVEGGWKAIASTTAPQSAYQCPSELQVDTLDRALAAALDF